jgi:hypothetical protein
MSDHHQNGHHANGQNGATNGHAGNGKAAPAPGGSDRRDAGGRFTTGNPGGPGNPFARHVAQLRSIMLNAVTADDLRAIIGKLLERAKAGDVAAAKLLLAYVLGKPAPAVNPDTLDWEELAQRLRCPPLTEVLQKILGHLRPDMLVELDRVMTMAQRRQLAQRIEEHILGGRSKAAAAPAAKAPPPATPTAAPAAAAEPTPARRRAAAMLQQGLLKGGGMPARSSQSGKKRGRR